MTALLAVLIYNSHDTVYLIFIDHSDFAGSIVFAAFTSFCFCGLLKQFLFLLLLLQIKRLKIYCV